MKFFLFTLMLLSLISCDLGRKSEPEFSNSSNAIDDGTNEGADLGDDGESPDSGDDGESPDSGDDGESPDSGDDGESPDSGGDGESPDSGDGESPDPGDGESPDSGDEGESPDPGEGESPDPGDGESPDSGDDGESPDSGDGESPDPGDGESPDSGDDGESPDLGDDELLNPIPEPFRSPKVSIDKDSLLEINSANASEFVVSGTCSEEGRLVVVEDAEGKMQYEVRCQGGSWGLTMDVTGFSHRNSLTLIASHSTESNFFTIDAAVITNHFICPNGFIGVPLLSGYTTRSFCVSKYEMKSNGNNDTVSEPGSLPYVNLDREEAISRCLSMGPGHDLIANDEWQTMARNIEGVSSNWEGGVIGSLGGINQGHSDSSPMSSLEASPSDDLPCIGTQSICDGQTWSNQKRTHKLSNGETIWDFSGNVWEWVKDDNKQIYGSQSFISQVTYASHPFQGGLSRGRTTLVRQTKDQFGPYGNYTGLNTSPYGGLGKGYFNQAEGTAIRGGYWASLDSSGIFTALFALTDVQKYDTLGFRCIYVPNVSHPKVSIDTIPLFIESGNASQFTLSGECSEEGLPVFLNVNNMAMKITCSQGVWEKTVDVTKFHKDPDVTFKVSHKNSYGLGAMKDTIVVTNNFYCPPNFISVPSMADYTTHSFCVAKYEMKKGRLGGATSMPNKIPHTNLTRDKALLRCTEKGGGYDLITNDQWQSIARNIEQVSYNWGEGLVGSEEGISRGHSDNSPSSLLEASYDNRDACVGTNQICDALTWSKQRRTHKLSNTQIIWDFSGNANEWVKDLNDYTYHYSTYMSEVNDQTHPNSIFLSRGTTSIYRRAKAQFGPIGSYEFPVSNRGGGLGYGILALNDGAVVRGGSFDEITSAGIFRTFLAQGRYEKDQALGFRCVYHPNRSVPIVSIDSESVEAINSSNVSQYPLSGSCSDEGGAIYATIGEVEEETSCSNGLWTAIFDLTGLSNLTGWFGIIYLDIVVHHASTDGRSSLQATSNVYSTFRCPKDYVGIPALSDYTTHGFCVAKYEMKEIDGEIVSSYEGSPKVSITQKKALAACEDLGKKYNLITNDEWQTIARNIEGHWLNWEEGYVGGEALNTGHSDRAPHKALAASANDNNACYLTGTSCNLLEWKEQKRTHILANGKIIWDFAGNAWEWVKDGNDFNYPAANENQSFYISQITQWSHPGERSLKWGLTTTPRVAKDQFGPSGFYNALKRDLFGGLGYAKIGGDPGGAVARGGSYAEHPVDTGIFTVSTDWQRSSEAEYIGFRCVYRP